MGLGGPLRFKFAIVTQCKLKTRLVWLALLIERLSRGTRFALDGWSWTPRAGRVYLWNNTSVVNGLKLSPKSWFSAWPWTLTFGSSAIHSRSNLRSLLLCANWLDNSQARFLSFAALPSSIVMLTMMNPSIQTSKWDRLRENGSVGGSECLQVNYESMGDTKILLLVLPEVRPRPWFIANPWCNITSRCHLIIDEHREYSAYWPHYVPSYSPKKLPSWRTGSEK